MNMNDNTQTPFSLVADFEGDMGALLKTPFKGKLPVLALRNMMLFPGVVGTVTVGRAMSQKVVAQSLSKGTLIAVAAQKDGEVEEPNRDDFYDEGVVARVMRVIDLPNHTSTAILQTYGAIRLGAISKRGGMMRVEAEPVAEDISKQDSEDFKALADTC